MIRKCSNDKNIYHDKNLVIDYDNIEFIYCENDDIKVYTKYDHWFFITDEQFKKIKEFFIF